MIGPTQSPLWFVVAGLVVAAVGTLALAVYVWINSDGDRTQQVFTLLLVSVFVWTAGEGGRLLTVSLGGKLIWHGVLYVGIVTLPLTWVAFALLYTGRIQVVRRPLVALALVEPAGVLAALYTNPLHGLFYREVSLATVGESVVLTTTAGPLWWVHFVVSYLLIGAGVFVLLQFALSAPSLYRTQTVSVIIATLLPVLTNVVVLFGPLSAPVVDLTPLAFALSALLLFAAVFYGRFLDLTPVAHDAVIRTLEDGILVVDDDGQVVDANPAGASMVAETARPESLVGRDLSTIEPVLAADTEATSENEDAGVNRGFETAAVSDGESRWHWVRQVDLEPATSKRGSVVVLTDITEKKRFERRLRELQLTHQQLLVAAERDQIVDIAIEAAASVLDLPITGVWRYDEQAGVLRPLGMTDTAEDLLVDQPVLTPGDLAWTAFDEGELKRYVDLEDHPEVHNPETPLRSEVHVPIGDWGVMSSGSTSKTEFQDVDFDLLRLLATGVEHALSRQARERELRRQNERLEEFTGVVSHDLRSPLNQATLYLEAVMADHDDDRIDAAVAANERATEMVDNLLALARQGKTVENPESRDLAGTVRDAWEAVPTGDCSLTIRGDLGSVAADHARLRQVFENLFGNAVEHGVTDRDSQVRHDGARQHSTGRQTRSDGPVEPGGDAVSVRVGRLGDGNGIYVADDGPGIPEDSREEVFDHGFTTAGTGTGFGLAIVDRIVGAHGWGIRVRESGDGGARFEIYGLETLDAD